MCRGALIGVGNVARNAHAPGWKSHSGVAILAATDTDASAREPFLEAFPDCRWYDSAEALFEGEDLDFVDISTPPATHRDLVRSGLSRGLHVLCEKPLVCRRDEFTPLANLASVKDRTLFTVHNWKYAPILMKATELVRAGAIGTVERVTWEVLRTQPAVAASADGSNWRTDPKLSGGGILVDHGWHAFYLLREWLGEPVRVRATLTTKKHREFSLEDTAEVKLTYPTGIAWISLTWAAGARQNRAVIEGSKGLMAIDGRSLLIAPRRGPEERLEMTDDLARSSHHPEWFGGVATSFLEEIANPWKRGKNLAEAATCVAILEAAQLSSQRRGESVSTWGDRP